MDFPSLRYTAVALCYGSYMDERSIEARGLSVLQPPFFDSHKPGDAMYLAPGDRVQMW